MRPPPRGGAVPFQGRRRRRSGRTRGRTGSIESARPPRFDDEAVGDATLVVITRSQRNLVDVFVDLTRGLGRYFGEDLRVTKLPGSRVEIVFG